jgi:hypothetical protein
LYTYDLLFLVEVCWTDAHLSAGALVVVMVEVNARVTILLYGRTSAYIWGQKSRNDVFLPLFWIYSTEKRSKDFFSIFYFGGGHIFIIIFHLSWSLQSDLDESWRRFFFSLAHR